MKKCRILKDFDFCIEEYMYPRASPDHISPFLENFIETDCLFPKIMVFLTGMIRVIGAKEDTK